MVITIPCSHGSTFQLFLVAIRFNILIDEVPYPVITGLRFNPMPEPAPEPAPNTELPYPVITGLLFNTKRFGNHTPRP